jgi:hypothetical protein
MANPNVDLTLGERVETIDRFTASRLNPFIGIHAEETVEHCTHAISDLGYIVSSLDHTGVQFDMSNLFRLFEAITIALRYEITGTQAKAKEPQP